MGASDSNFDSTCKLEEAVDIDTQDLEKGNHTDEPLACAKSGMKCKTEVIGSSPSNESSLFAFPVSGMEQCGMGEFRSNYLRTSLLARTSKWLGRASRETILIRGDVRVELCC